MELKLGANQARGTRILALQNAAKYRSICQTLSAMAQGNGAEEIILPSIEPLSLYQDTNQLYTFPDTFAGQRELMALRPNGTTTCQVIAGTVWKNRHDVKLFYLARCWRHQVAKFGHHREFTEFGFELLNPRSKITENADWIIDLATRIAGVFTPQCEVESLKRYEEPGFSINCPQLGGQRQICHGGPRPHGYGFTMHVERVMLL